MAGVGLGFCRRRGEEKVAVVDGRHHTRVVSLGGGGEWQRRYRKRRQSRRRRDAAFEKLLHGLLLFLGVWIIANWHETINKRRLAGDDGRSNEGDAEAADWALV